MALKVDYMGTKPSVANDGDAGLDLYAATNVNIPPGMSVPVPTGTSLAIPDGMFGLLVGRSGLGVHSGVRLSNSVGIIDSGYRGVIVVSLHNDSDVSVRISGGDRIAQVVLVRFVTVELNRVSAFDATVRGENGFGSSGE